MNGALLLGIGLAVCAADTVAGLYLANQGSDLALRSEAERRQAEAARRAGRLVLTFAPLVLLVFAALAFGLIPVEGVDPIRLF